MRTWRLRPATPGDLPAIERIELESFGNPWLADVYAQELERDVGCVEVAENAEASVIGVFCVWCVATESHLMRIATAPSHRRQGIGRDLLAAALDRARSAGCESMTLEVAASNEAAIELYASFGFAVVGRRVGYYRLPPDDALLMRRDLAGPAVDAGPSALAKT
jgi:[ribosomal protein S18]-alanine N-acetyltransferase